MPPAKLLRFADQLCDDLDRLTFSDPVAYTSNPLKYARRPYEKYVRLYGTGPREALLLGMNPGPFGMAQTGVPFGDVGMVRDWLGIEEPVDPCDDCHPARPVKGFALERGEVSGQRFWGWARERFGPPKKFFARFFVANYCPLLFTGTDDTGNRAPNITPEKLKKEERDALFAACDAHLNSLIEYFSPRVIVGVGRFAEDRARAACDAAGRDGIVIGRILHPSPASPAANRDWAGQAEKGLRDLGIDIP